MSKLKVDEIRSADRSVSDSANITLADDGNVTFGGDIQITGNPPEIQATGDDTNIHLKLTPKGTGGVSVGDILHAFLPVGMISPFGITTVPAGWLYCNGATLGNASSGATNASDDYEALFDLIKNLWGNSGGTFSAGNLIHLPDLKGAFLRGIDTKVYSLRNKVGPTNVGDYQEDKFQGHEIQTQIQAGNSDSGDGAGYGLLNQSAFTVTDNRTGTIVTDSTNGTPRTGAETQPFNAGVKYCIKY